MTEETHNTVELQNAQRAEKRRHATEMERIETELARIEFEREHGAVTGRNALAAWCKSLDAKGATMDGTAARTHRAFAPLAAGLVEAAEYCEHTRTRVKRDEIPAAMLLIEASETALARLRAEFTRYAGPVEAEAAAQ
jgi:hypothetical protein